MLIKFPPTGLRAFSSSGRREHQEAYQRAQAQFEYDWRKAAQAEEQRQRQLADYHRQYQAWADGERKRIMDHNGQVPAHWPPDELRRPERRLRVLRGGAVRLGRRGQMTSRAGPAPSGTGQKTIC